MNLNVFNKDVELSINCGVNEDSIDKDEYIE